jgi:hypothetical protein
VRRDLQPLSQLAAAGTTNSKVTAPTETKEPKLLIGFERWKDFAVGHRKSPERRQNNRKKIGDRLFPEAKKV